MAEIAVSGWCACDSCRKYCITPAAHNVISMTKACTQIDVFDKITLVILAKMMSAKRLARIAIILKPATLLKVPYVPISHPFIERLIGTIRREILDKTFYWHATDLQNKLELFQCYYNDERCHGSIQGLSSLQKADEKTSTVVSIHDYRWKKHCRGLFQLPIAA